MIKSLVPEVSKLVGVSSALLLNQLTLLLKTWGKDKIYRTNKQLFEDMEGILSESTIKRSKKKLVDEGLINLSFDRGIKRQSFFSLTEKAKNLLEGFINPKRKEVSVEKETSMEKSFKEGFTNPNAVKKPFVKEEKIKTAVISETKDDVSEELDKKFGEGLPENNPDLNFNKKRKSLKDTLKEEKQKIEKHKELNESTLNFREKLLNKVLPSVGKVLRGNSPFESPFEEDMEFEEMRGYYGI